VLAAEELLRWNGLDSLRTSIVCAVLFCGVTTMMKESVLI
jgi:hypothetical protein